MNPEFNLDELKSIPDPLRSPVPSLDDDRLPPFPPSRTRARVRRDRLVTLAVVLILEGVLLLATKVRSLTGDVVLWGALGPMAAAFTAWLVLTRARGGAATSRLVLALLPAMVFVLTAWISRDAPYAELAALATPTLKCAGLSLVFTIIPVAGFGVAYRHGFASAAVGRGAALGVALGVVGAAVLRLHCPQDAFVHVVLGHGFALLLGLAAGAGLGARVLRS